MGTRQGIYLLAGFAGALLVAASAIAALHSWRRSEGSEPTGPGEHAKRTASAWVMASGAVAALLAGRMAIIAVAGLVSCVALFEFLGQCGIRWREHRCLVSACFAFAVTQYGLVAGDRTGLFLAFVPLAAFLALPALAVLLGDTKDILRTYGRAQWGLMIPVYGMSHLPAIFLLHLGGSNEAGVLLVGYVVVVAQISDTMQYAFGKAFGRTLMSPAISPKKTVEGLVGGGLTAILAGSALWPATPFDLPQAAALSTAIVASGILGGLVLSAIKRDLGIKDWGRLIPGHGGVLDRADSICFAAPVFFHLARWISASAAG